MRKTQRAIDGFVPRNDRRTIGNTSAQTPRPLGDAKSTRSVEEIRPLQTAALEQPRNHVSRREVDDSLNGIDDEQFVPRKRGLFGRKKRAKNPISRRRRIIRWIIRAVIILALLVGAFIGIRAIIATDGIFKGNLLDFFQNKPLKMDANGRTNILVYGTSGSVEDTRHEGANLTDTLMVLSIDQNKKNAFLVSLPRDLYINYTPGCSSGFQFKINELFECTSTTDANDEAGAKALQAKVGEITGLKLQYYAHVNWAVVTGAIQAVGGVSVDVQGNGSCAYLGMPDGSIVDYNMQIRYTPGNHTMNGDQALRFSRARGSAGGCGLDQGDFDRQANQQKVLMALQQKATSAGTLTNVGKVTGLIDALGANLRTNFETSEIQTLMSLGRDIPSDKVVSISLVDEDNPLIGGDMINGASVQVPTAGQFEYSEIQSFINKKLNASAIVKEEAHIALFNGSGVEGYAGTQQTMLEEKGYTITAVENAPAGTYRQVEIYDLRNKKPATKKALEKQYGVTVQRSKGPIPVSTDTDFVIIFGATRASEN